MNVTKNIHQIRIDFQVTKQVQRFVYVYLITGKYCYLIDSGVAGSEKIIEAYMQKIGRKPEEIKGIFLTHAHPDHIGGAAAIKEYTNCSIYCSEQERAWVENIDLQFKERPIPNFYQLAGQSVPVDKIVGEGDKINPEEGIEIEVLETAGHSKGDLSYLMKEGVLLSGDAIPAAGDFPIITDISNSIQTLDKIRKCGFIKCCPAWDRVYEKAEKEDLLQSRKNLLENLKKTVHRIDHQYTKLSKNDKMKYIAECMGLSGVIKNPFFAASVEACRKE